MNEGNTPHFFKCKRAAALTEKPLGRSPFLWVHLIKWEFELSCLKKHNVVNWHVSDFTFVGNFPFV